MARIDDPVALAEAYAQLGADPQRGQRYAVALALSLVLTTLLLGLVHWRSADDREAPPVAVVLEREPTPSPTPRPTPPPTPVPTPVPTPRPRLVRVTPAPVAQRAAPRRSAQPGGARPLPTTLPSVALPTVAVVSSPAPSAPAAAAAGAPGVGSGSGTGSGNGAGAGSGTGAGNGTGGSGSGQVNADVPCGYVEFVPDGDVRIDRGTAYERIRATVHFRDGHSESAVFPYDWVYPNAEQTDPWSATNTRLHANDPVRAQLPPPGSDLRRLPPLIRYIIDHTTPNGRTLLEECPPLRP